MLFSSLIFLYLFIPALILVYFLMPKKGRNLVLLVFSLFFYAWGEPKYLLNILISISAGYVSGLIIGKLEKKSLRLGVTIVSSLVILSFLAYFKYADFAISLWNGALGAEVPFLRLALPIGISFYTFQILSYVIDVYRGNTEVQKNPIDFGAYVVLFPQLIAGPIVRYVDIAAELKERKCSFELTFSGAQRFIIGLGKKIIFANQLGVLVDHYTTTAEPTVLFAWLAALAYMLQIYLDFSGYSDMAIGLGRIFGFKFPENFNHPYLSVTLTEFWRRWHMTLGSWFRDYVYIPLGGNRVGKGRWLLNIVIVWAATGLWHGAGWNFILWGLFFGVLLIVEKLWCHKFFEKNRLIGHIYVLVAVLLSFVLFRFNSLGEAVVDFKIMFGASDVAFSGTETMYVLRSSVGLLLLSMIACTPLSLKVVNAWENSRFSPILTWLKPVALAAILLLCTAFLVDGSFNPFLYFRF